MVVLEYSLNEVGELLFHFWLLLQGALQGEEAIERLLSVIGERKSQVSKRKWSHPAVNFVLEDLLFHVVQEGLILY